MPAARRDMDGPPDDLRFKDAGGAGSEEGGGERNSLSPGSVA